MKKTLTTTMLLTIMLMAGITANAQEKKTTKLNVDKQVEVVNGKEMVTFTITKIEDGKVTVVDTTFDGTNGYNEAAILKSLGVDLPGKADSTVMKQVVIEKIMIDEPGKKMIFKSDEQMDVQVDEIDGRSVIRTIKDGDTMINTLEIGDKKILFNEQEIYMGDSMKDVDVKLLKWINEDGDTTHNIRQKEIIIIFKADVKDLNDEELKKLISDDVITKRAKPMDEVNVSAYPNPTSGKLTISFTLKSKGDTDVKLINSTGAIIYKESLPDFTGEYNKGIDLATNSKGVYYLVVTQGKQVLTKKIVLQ